MAAVSVGAAALAAGIGAASNIGQTIYTTERNVANSNWQAQVQREFEERMASSQYQRAVADMRAAGLNPGAIGAGGLGSNAVPSGAAATGNYGHALGNDFTNVFSSAVSAAMAKDKDVTRKIVQQMKSETAEQVARIRNQGALELQDRKTNSAKDVEAFKKLNQHNSYAVPEARNRANALARRYASELARLRK